MEEDIIRIANQYYYFSEKYDKKINNIVNRYENRTNQLFMDLRHREVEYKRVYGKMDYLLKNTTETVSDYKVSICEIGDIDTRFRYMLLFMYLYTFVVLAMVWNL